MGEKRSFDFGLPLGRDFIKMIGEFSASVAYRSARTAASHAIGSWQE
jgi:hypothetical protein